MKKKIKDVTIGELFNLCRMSRSCFYCPFNEYFKSADECGMYDFRQEYLNEEVQV